VNRPPDGVFWQAIFEILKGTRTFLVWPAPDPPTHCVANPDLEGYVDSQLEHMGVPAFVRSPAEIGRAIEASFDSLG
jgi:hypothetical protein